MQLDELKIAWKQYDARLQSAKMLSERLIVSMVKEKSQSRLSRVKRHYLVGIFYMGGWLVLGLAIIFGNPFDFKHTIEYLPLAIYCLCIAVLIVTMIKTNRDLRKVEINHDSLDVSLDRIIRIVAQYEDPNRLLGWTLKLLLATTILFPLSFLPRKIGRAGLSQALIDTVIPILISAALVFIAYKLGAFKERHGRRFREYQQELNELKGSSDELRAGLS